MFPARLAALVFLIVPIAPGQSNGPLMISTASPILPAAAGLPYSQSFSATGGTPPYTWSLVSGALPAGLVLSESGAITGTPGSTGTSGFTIRVTDSASVMATQTFSITVITSAPQTRFGTLSHIAAGGGWDTTITLINTSSVPIGVAVVFRADDGTVLSLPFKVTQQGATQTTTATSANALLNPNGSVLVAAGGQPNLAVGWADVLSTGPVSGFGIMRATPPNDKPSEATVPLQTTFPSSLTLAYDNAAGYVTGVAMVNLASAAANISATIWDDNGSQLGAQQIVIAGNGHSSFALPDKIPLTAGKRGIVQFQSTSGGIAGLGLRFSPSGTFTDVPVVSQQ